MALTVDTTIQPIKITGTTAADTEIFSKDQGVFIQFIRWYKPTTIGHLCHITDGLGNTIMKMNATAVNDTQMWPVYNGYHGIRCDDMDSGELYIHIK